MIAHVEQRWTLASQNSNLHTDFSGGSIAKMMHEKALGRAKAGTGSPVNFAGTWRNDLGSKAIIDHTGDALSGTYESAVSSDGTSTVGDLRGYADGDLISFVVHWREFQAITAWVGQLEPSGVSLKTLWQMSKQVDAGEEWASVNLGADVFTRQ